MNRILLLTLLVCSLLTGCTKKKYPPQLSSVSPSSAPIGADITLAGAQFGDAPTVMIGSQTAITKTHTDNSITLTIPRMATGPTTIRVQNPDGSSDPLPFTVLQPQPQLTRVEPANGLPGTLVKLTGDFLDKLKTVRFGSAQAEVSGAPSEKEISVKVPAVSRGPVKITLETEGGQGQADFIVAAMPQITGFTPKRLTVGTTLTITGTNLLDGVVSLNGLAVDKAQTQVQDTQIKLSVPQTATSGKLTVSVFDKLVTTSTDSLLIIPPPIIDATGLSSLEGIKADKLTLTGRNLVDVTGVSFGGVVGTGLKVLSNTQLEVLVPGLAQSGEVVVSVTSPGGTVSAAQKFLMILAPGELSADPDRQGRSKEITIQGKNLHRITEVKLNGKAAPITSRTEGSLVKITVPGDATTGKVSLTNRAGSGTSPASVVVVLKPVIISFSPKAAVGGRVILKGDFLLNAQVYFATTQKAAENDGKKEDNEVWVKVPPEAKDGPIRVWNTESGEYVDTEVFNVLLTPVVASIVSEYGNQEGFVWEKLTLNGQNLDECTVRFEGSAQNAEVISAESNRSRLVVKIPADARTGKVVVRNVLSAASSSPDFRIIGVPDITDISPNRAKSGSTLMVKGNNLKRVDEVKIGGQVVAKSAYSENGEGTQLTITVPDAGLRGRVYAHNKAGGDEHKGEEFVVVRVPTVSSFSPLRQVVGEVVSVKGSYLFGARVLFGGKEASEYSKRNADDEVIAKVPEGAGDGKVQVINEAGSGEKDGFSLIRKPQNLAFSPGSGVRGSEVLITGQYLDNVTEVKFSGGGSSSAQIINRSGGIRVQVPDNAQDGTICLSSDGAQVCTASSYNVMLPPTLSSINPNQGVGGTEVTIFGSNLSGVQEVKFGDKPATVKSGGDNGKVVVNCPDFSSVQGVQVTVKTSSGLSNPLNFTGQPPTPKPTIDKSRCVPTGVVPGSALTLKGSNFGKITQVRFTNGSVSSDQFIRNETNDITVKVPSNTQSGLVQLVNDTGAGEGVWFDVITGGDGLNIGNIATNVGSVTTGVVSDGCDPTSFFYCMPNRQYETGFRQYSQRCQKTYYTTEQIPKGGSTYEVFTGARTDTGGSITSTTDILKLERNSQNTAYTGFAILVTPSDTYMGSIMQSGDIYLYSVTNGMLQKMCKRNISRFSYPTSTICSDCK